MRIEPQGRDHLAVGLTASQHEAVFTDATPLCIVAGAGAGKTRVLTRRIARRLVDGDASPEATLAVTFTRKAAGELRSRLSALGIRESIRTGTFHGVAFAFLREYWSLRDRPAAKVAGDKSRILAPLTKSLGLRSDRASLRRIAAQIEWAKARGANPEPEIFEQASATTSLPASPRQLAELFAGYEREKRRRGVLDFDDLLIDLHTALTHDAAYAHVMARRVQHLFIDEFQDVTPLQWKLALALTQSTDPPDLCVVGDDAQAIFGFNGAQPEYLTEFAATWADAEVVNLAENFRCAPQILDAAESVLGTPKTQTPVREDSTSAPEIVAHATSADEIAWVATAVKRRRAPGRSWSQTAILARTNAQIAPIVDALEARAIPVRAGAGVGFLQLPEVRRLLDQIRGASGTEFESALADLTDAGHRTDNHATRVLAGLADDYRASGTTADPESFESFLATALAREAVDPSVADGVNVLTIHRAKGLEFDTVIIVGVEEGLLPLGSARTDRALEEERRLLYVAMTRARRNLMLSWCETRDVPETQRGPRRRSRFLEPVVAGLAASASAGAVATPFGGRARAIRAALGIAEPAASNPDTDLVRRLRDWRERSARRRGIRPEDVISESALQELARVRPAAPAEVAAVPGVDRFVLAASAQELFEICATFSGQGVE